MNIFTMKKVCISLIRNIFLKIMFKSNYQCNWICSCDSPTFIRLERDAKLIIGRHLSSRRNLTINVRKNAICSIGDNVNFNDNCSITCRQNISIGNEVIFGPGCMIFDHDHDYHKFGCERRKSTITGKIEIGNGVWFGANCIILKDTQIGDNCVFSAGSIIKGTYEDNSLVIQKKYEQITSIR